MTLKEIKEELQSVLKGKTLDTIIPPFTFFIALQFLELFPSAVLALSLSILLSMLRIIKRNSVFYSIIGLLTTLFAAMIAYLFGNINDFFLPGIIGSVLLVVITLFSLIIRRPLPLLLSHITRGWTFSWFLRKDIYPAYFETGLIWLLYFTLRAAFQVFFYLTSSTEGLSLMSSVFGFPLTLLVLVLTYVYGLWRLKTLKGPGIEEYDNGKSPPYKGQTRGF